MSRSAATRVKSERPAHPVANRLKDPCWPL